MIKSPKDSPGRVLKKKMDDKGVREGRRGWRNRGVRVEVGGHIN